MKTPIKCRDCKVDAVWVSLGQDIGEYWFCRQCKKEEKEWTPPETSDKLDYADTPGWLSGSYITPRQSIKLEDAAVDSTKLANNGTSPAYLEFLRKNGFIK
jgi:hypothetical protein